MTLRDYLKRRSMKALLAMATVIVASWIYVSAEVGRYLETRQLRQSGRGALIDVVADSGYG